jgi:hypothetical protein
MNTVKDIIAKTIRDKAVVKKVNHRLAVESGTLRDEDVVQSVG